MNKAMQWLLVATCIASCRATDVARRDEVHSPMPRSHAAELAAGADRMLAESWQPDYGSPTSKTHIDQKLLRVRYLEACRAGDHRSCWMVQSVQGQGARLDEDAYDEVAQQRVRHNCRDGDMMSCRAVLLKRDELSDDLPGHLGRSDGCLHRGDCDVPALLAECKVGFASSCFAVVVREPPGVDLLEINALANSSLLAGCHAGLLDECLSLRANLETTPTGANLADRIDVGTQTCWLGLSGCAGLAALTRHSEPKRARDVLERLCQLEEIERDAIDECKAVWQGYVSHEWPEPVPGRADALRAWLDKHGGAKD